MFRPGGGIPKKEIDRLEELIEENRRMIEELQKSKAGTEEYGLTRISSSESVTEDAGLVLGAKEKNASIIGTMAEKFSSQIREMKEQMQAVSHIVLNDSFLKPASMTDNCYAVRHGHIVFLRITVYFNEQIPAATVFMQLPEKYRPKYAVKAPTSSYATENIISHAGQTASIKPNGEILSDFNIGAKEWFFIYVSYYAD